MRTVNCYSSYRRLVAGVDTKIPLINGELTTAINLDNAATTPPFLSVLKAITDFSPLYSSVHRGTGYKSQYVSYFYEDSRRIVADFVNGCPEKDSIIFVKNTTEAINKLAHHLRFKFPNSVVLSTFMEHHSNDLPWRRGFSVDYVAIDSQGRLQLEDLERKLIAYKGKVKLVTVTGASNVTGYKNPIHKAAALAHKHGALILVDGAQLVPHAVVDMKPHSSPEHIDFLVFSGHKMYAPFGIGVLIARNDMLEGQAPDIVGGGTVDIVTPELVTWAELPHKEEAGSPNIMGVVALVAAIKTLDSLGMKTLEENERALADYTIYRLCQLRDIEVYCSNDYKEDRVAIVPFNVAGLSHHMVAKILSYEGGIAVRNGCFCAQPYIQRLLGISQQELEERINQPKVERPGMVRISLGLYNTIPEIDALALQLNKIILNKKYYLQKYSDMPELF